MPIERMKTPGSRKCSDRRMRSPRSAPCVNGLDGSTEITPTVCSAARIRRTSAAIRLDLPTPGGPVIPTTYARARLRVHLAHELVRERVAVLDERDRPGERAPVTLAHSRGERLAGPLAASRHVRCRPSLPALRSQGSGFHARARSPRPRPPRTGTRRRPRPSARRTRSSAGRPATIPSPSTA